MNPEHTPLEIVPAPETDPWPQRKRDVRTREWRIYEKLLNKLELAIDRLLGDADESMSPSDIARLLELAAKLGRLAAGLPSDHTAHSIQDDRAVRVEISAAIKKIYSEPLEVIVARMRGCAEPIDANQSGTLALLSQMPPTTERILDSES